MPTATLPQTRASEVAYEDQRRPILIIGGTRGTGFLIAQILQSKQLPVRVLARSAQGIRRLRQEIAGIEVIEGDITEKATLRPAVEGVCDIIFTAGVRSGHPAREALVKATDYQGVLNTLEVARDADFRGRFLYMTTIGVATSSLSATLLNLFKGNALVWRRQVEPEIRASGFDYSIIRAGFLVNGPAGRRAVEVSQGNLPLSPRYLICRSDVAEAFVTALDHPRAAHATFEVVWGKGGRRGDWNTMLDRVHPDA